MSQNTLNAIAELVSAQRVALARAMRGTTGEIHRAVDEADRLADLIQHRIDDLRHPKNC